MSETVSSPSATSGPSSTQKTIERRKIADLKPHPLQPVYFPTDPTDNIELFAETLKRGLDNPVEVTPDGVIICGHRRTAAAKFLGWTEIDCWVRHDLAEKGTAAIEERFLEDNLERRQLCKLAIARCYQRLRTIAVEEWRAGRRDRAELPRGDTRDFIGQRLGLSGRTLDRLLNILRAPQSVQDAFERDDLPLVLADKVARLSKDVQEQIEAEIEAGNSAKQVIAAKLKADAERRAGHGLHRVELLGKWNRHLGHLRNEVPLLKAHLAALPKPGAAAGEVIDNAIDFLLQLKRRHEETSAPDRCPASLRERQPAA